MVDESHGERRLGSLILGSIGVVFGDIGTSPLYALKECFSGAHPLAADPPHVLGVLSLIFWSVTIVVSVKYVVIIMRADNKGEGGSLALLALASRLVRKTFLAPIVVVLGIFAAALFYGDSMITPAISVLSAVEGLRIVAPKLDAYVVPLTLAILFGLFAFQKSGTALVGAFFGPIMGLWFATLALLGIIEIFERPEVLLALNPVYAFEFFAIDGWLAFLALGSVVLAVTGAEALYTDMGHFGRFPIRLSWFCFVLPALMLNYFGQGALILSDANAIDSPFYRLAPDWAGLPLLILATAAAIIASQAVISGAFSVTKQAIQLGYLPRMKIIHTSAAQIGQVYLPFVNWTLCLFVIALVLGFQSSTSLAAAYGIAVTGTMIIDALLISVVSIFLWRWSPLATGILVGLFLVIDLAFLGANLTKLFHGGWFPLAIGLLIFMVLTTWKRGRQLLSARLSRDALGLDDFLKSVSERVLRVPGTAVFLTATRGATPGALLHNMKHNKVLHERVVVLTVVTIDEPYSEPEEHLSVRSLPNNFWRVVVRYGFMEEQNVPRAVQNCAALGLAIDPATCSYFLSRETVIPSPQPGMAPWRERLFAWLSRLSTSAMDFFGLPPNRVIELGSQIEI